MLFATHQGLPEERVRPQGFFRLGSNVGAIVAMLETRFVCLECCAGVTEGSKKSEKTNTVGNFQYFLLNFIGESFQSEIFDAKHVPRVHRQTSAGWTQVGLMQAAYQFTQYISCLIRIENKRLGAGSAAEEEPGFQKLNPED